MFLITNFHSIHKKFKIGKNLIERDNYGEWRFIPLFDWNVISRGTLKYLLFASIYLLLFSLLFFLRDFNAFSSSFIGFINSFLLVFYLINIGFYLTPPWGVVLLYMQYKMGYTLLNVVLFSKDSMIITSIILGFSMGIFTGVLISLILTKGNDTQKASNKKTS